MTTFDFAKLVHVNAVKAGLQSRPDEGRGAREAAATTYEELLAEFRRQEETAREIGRVYGRLGKKIKAAKVYSEAFAWHDAARLLERVNTGRELEPHGEASDVQERRVDVDRAAHCRATARV